MRAAFKLLANYAPVFAIVGLATAIGAALVRHFELSEVIMVYLLGIIAVSVGYGRGPALLASTLSVALFDFCFVPPYYTFRVADTRFIFTFAVMFIVGLVISRLSGEVKRQAERALRAEKEALRSALLSSISHDLRTPLCAIAGSASVLLDDEHPLPRGEQRELLTMIFDEADHLNRLVRNLLDMSRLQSGGLLVKKEWMTLEEVIGSALERLERLLARHPVHVALPPSLPLVPIDGTLIEQVFYNLLENASKHTPPGTDIFISASIEAGTLVVQVKDTGPGLPAACEDRVFERFFRGSRARQDSGVGLGLAICRGIVEAHGGQIHAHNRPEGGALFRFTLPLEGTPPRLPPDERSPSSHETNEGSAGPTTHRSQAASDPAGAA